MLCMREPTSRATVFAASLLLSAVTLTLFHYVKRSLSARQEKRALLQERLRQFAIANRSGELTSAQIECFWTQTSDAYWLGGTAAINAMRNDLYNNALLLLNTKNALTDQSASIEQHTQFLNLHTKTVQWFSASLVQMDALFTPSNTAQVTAPDVWNELVRLVCRSIRA